MKEFKLILWVALAVYFAISAVGGSALSMFLAIAFAFMAGIVARGLYDEH